MVGEIPKRGLRQENLHFETFGIINTYVYSIVIDKIGDQFICRHELTNIYDNRGQPLFCNIRSVVAKPLHI